MRHQLVCFLLAATAITSAGCFDVFSDPLLFRQSGQDSPNGGTGGSTGGGGTGGTPLGCVPSADNKDIDAGCGVFVSSSLGKPGGTGTQDKPFATIGEALGEGKPIYVCAETLNEAVNVPSGDVALYGALDCSKGWLYDPTKKTKLVAAADKVTLTVGKDVGLSVSDFQVEAADATKAGGSSVAVVADVGATLGLTRCDVVAGIGMDGAAGDPPSGAAPGGTDGNAGANACTTGVVVGGESVTNACDEADPNDDSVSGAGGVGQSASGSAGNPGTPLGATNGGTGQLDDAGMCTDGTIGDTGADGTDAKGGKGLGELTSQGFQGTSGAAGGTGKPGQGGGGGGGAKGGTGANKCADGAKAGGASGGSGGSGGCGGLGGKGGQAAGASIGLVSLGATLTFKEVSVTTAAGGTGGTGGDRQDGGFGGGPGIGGTNGGATALKPGCAGGGGGAGGKGGLGGGGQGGHSLGLAYKGTAPDVKGVTFQVASAGDGGPGGNASNDVALHGDPGQACKTISFDLGADSCSK